MLVGARKNQPYPWNNRLAAGWRYYENERRR
ncbi:Os02g0104400 [Oryza sativa Japonica Group]|uniref:Os02g0104400 protein n=1 Tax=Oryza sativa subsp. japonica TaxID=39947 RepID=Q0E4R2_ORYSJ|nr:Os02g0104400 [Oryza sativa Japonica Group]|eukprot:NP_001045612.1 Os02g0104400 [Oryza sativa Japonica Group]